MNVADELRRIIRAHGGRIVHEVREGCDVLTDSRGREIDDADAGAFAAFVCGLAKRAPVHPQARGPARARATTTARARARAIF